MRAGLARQRLKGVLFCFTRREVFGGLVPSVTLQGETQAFFQAEGGLVIKLLPGQGEIGDFVLAVRGKQRGDVLCGDF